MVWVAVSWTVLVGKSPVRSGRVTCVYLSLAILTHAFMRLTCHVVYEIKINMQCYAPSLNLRGLI